MKVLIISAGLMGGSIAKALSQKKCEVHVVNREPLQYEDVVFYTNFEDVPKIDFDIICICSPRGRKYEIYEKMFEEANRLCSKDTFIVDISSVQNQNNLFKFKYPNFVPCHPIAGSEKTGFENSSPAILQSKTCLVVYNNLPRKVFNFWELCGMIVDNSITSCMEHDHIFSKISHLPQLISFNFPSEEKPQYKEFYRLKNSSRAIWDEIFLHNRSWIFESLHDFNRIACSSLYGHRGGNAPQIPWEEKISNSFAMLYHPDSSNDVGRELEDGLKNYVGSGFKTIISALAVGSNGDAPEEVYSIIQKAYNYLSAL